MGLAAGDHAKSFFHCDLLFSPSVCPTAWCALAEESMYSSFDLLEELLKAIAKTLVDHPEEVQVRTVRRQVVSILELRVHPEDLGKVIGRHGRTANAIRTIIGAAGWKLHEHVTVEIMD
jgi:predicted RNA-binding protein YlqC (UPF0109 family)